MQEARGSSPLISTINRQKCEKAGNRKIVSLFLLEPGARLVIWAAMLAWVVTTPLGLPVAPLVSRIMARRYGAAVRDVAPVGWTRWWVSPSLMARDTDATKTWLIGTTIS